MKGSGVLGVILLASEFVMWLGVSLMVVWFCCSGESAHMIGSSKVKLCFEGSFVVHGGNLLINILEFCASHLSTS